ncbi:energy-coupling factor transporter transmembrane component T [Anaerovorax odorimutans]|uniref:energy-coupling factor transporter transmembrane component T n=1 Tax=Anaerovorax odorimutans TaxID=109327 RepID=UPI0004206807|nr:energy-coupling factor transporter transmembrane component T [Anaerovorax odorimutans]
MNDTFGTYHPIINFIYFCTVILLGMFIMHPIFLCTAIIGAFTYSVFLNGKKAVRFNLIFLLPMMVLVSIINPLFNHRGMTILFYFRDNPITMESIVYGIFTGIMFAVIILWFSCYNEVMTSDKFIYLFGKIIPALSLIFSMVLRFIPRFKEQLKIVYNAQKCIGRDISSGTFLERMYYGIKIFSIMITWSLENSIETADSMRSRGYGLRGRTSFSIYRFDSRDTVVSVVLIMLIILVISGILLGENSIIFFPLIKTSHITIISVIVFIAYFLICFLPIILNMIEIYILKRNKKSGDLDVSVYNK